MRFTVTIPEASANDMLTQRILPQTLIDQTGNLAQSGNTINFGVQLRVTAATMDFKAGADRRGQALANIKMNNVHIVGHAQVTSVVVDLHTPGFPPIPIPFVNVPMNPPVQAPIDFTADVMGHVTTRPSMLPDANGASTVPGWAVNASFDVPTTTVNIAAMTAGIADTVRTVVHDTLKSLHGAFGHQLLPDAVINTVSDNVKNAVNALLTSVGFTAAVNALINSAIHLIGVFQPSVGVKLFQFPSAQQPIPGVTITVTGIVPITSDTDMIITVDIV